MCIRDSFLSEELDVIDQQDVDVAKLVAEAGHLVVAQRVNHLVGELLARHIADRSLRHALLDLMADGLHEVGLSHADAAIKEKRVICLGRALSDGLTSCVSELVAAANHEGIEGIARIELCGAVPIKS